MTEQKSRKMVRQQINEKAWRSVLWDEEVPGEMCMNQPLGQCGMGIQGKAVVALLKTVVCGVVTVSEK